MNMLLLTLQVPQLCGCPDNAVCGMVLTGWCNTPGS
jgi:hypothetical protein